MNKWIAHKTNNDQGTDFKEVSIDGKISELTFTIKPHPGYWRAGFKLFDPNGNVFPLKSSNSFLFHLGSTPTDQEYGVTAYLNGEWVKELIKTRKYPSDKLLKIRLVINHNNFLRVYINNSLEFKPKWHLKNPNIREKVVLLAWGDQNDYEVEFKDIDSANWKIIQNRQKDFSKNERSHWYKNPYIVVPSVVTILAAFISAPWWNPFPQKYVDNNNAYIEVQNTPIIPTSLPTQSLIVEQSINNDMVTIDEGRSYIDMVSGVTIGVNRVFIQTDSDLTLTFPGKISEEFKNIKSGKVFPYIGIDGNKYNLTIFEIGSSSVDVRIDKIFF